MSVRKRKKSRVRLNCDEIHSHLPRKGKLHREVIPSPQQSPVQGGSVSYFVI